MCQNPNKSAGLLHCQTKYFLQLHSSYFDTSKTALWRKLFLIFHIALFPLSKVNVIIAFEKTRHSHC